MALPVIFQPYQVAGYGIYFMDERVSEQFNRFGQSSATRTIVCAWLDRVPLINGLGSYGQLNAANQYTYATSAVYSTAPFLYFNNIKTEMIPLGGLNTDPNGIVGAALCRAEIEYKSQPYIEIDQGSLSIDFAIQDLLLPQNSTSWYFDGNTSTPVDPSQVPATQATFTTFSWCQFNLISIPTATLYAASAAPIDQSGLFGIPTGNLMYMGARTNRRMGTLGIETWDMTVQLVAMPNSGALNNSWNSVFFPKALGGNDTFHQIKSSAGNLVFALDAGGNIPALVKNIGY